MKTLQISRGIWSYRLSPGAFRLYCAMQYLAEDGVCRARYRELTEACRLSENTIRRRQEDLQQKRLIVPLRTRSGGLTLPWRLAPVSGSGYIPIPSDVLQHGDIQASAFLVYAYLLDTMDLKGVAKPGYHAISMDLGITINTAARAVRKLARVGVIRKEYVIKPDGSFDNNRYHMIPA